MSSPLIKTLLATAVIIAATAATGMVSAAPVMHTSVSPAHSLVQPVRWVHRHGHRVWVSNHHHYR